MLKKLIVGVRALGNWMQQLLDVRLSVGSAYGSAQLSNEKPVHL